MTFEGTNITLKNEVFAKQKEYCSQLGEILE